MEKSYKELKEQIIDTANNMGVKQGKIRLKSLYWYLMYIEEITHKEYNALLEPLSASSDDFFKTYLLENSNNNTIEHILLDDILRIENTSDILKGMIALGEDDPIKWIDNKSTIYNLPYLAYEIMSYSNFSIEEHPDTYLLDSTYLNVGEYLIFIFYGQIKENRVTSRNVNYNGFRAFFKGATAGSYNTKSSSNYEWINTIDLADCYITNQRIIMTGLNNLTNAIETKVIKLSSITKFEKNDMEIEIFRQSKNIRLVLYEEGVIDLLTLTLKRLINKTYNKSVLPENFYSLAEESRIVYMENSDSNQTTDVLVEKISTFFNSTLEIQELKTTIDNVDKREYLIFNSKYNNPNMIVTLSFNVDSPESSHYLHSLVKSNNHEWQNMVKKAYLEMKNYDISVFQYELEIIDPWRVGEEFYILFNSVSDKNCSERLSYLEDYLDSGLEEVIIPKITDDYDLNKRNDDYGGNRPNDDIPSQLRQYKNLVDDKVITQDDYDVIKNRILDI